MKPLLMYFSGERFKWVTFTVQLLRATELPIDLD
jgi:hypothetical protein